MKVKAEEEEERESFSGGAGMPENVVDAEVMLGDMRKNGYDVAENHEDADAIIVTRAGLSTTRRADRWRRYWKRRTERGKRRSW